jgi:hypothetical protein
MDKQKQGSAVLGGIRPGIARREGHMEPAERRKAYEAEQAGKKGK